MTITVTSNKVRKVPPDGGYGWVIVFAYSLSNSVILSLYFSFGLVFKEAISDVNLSHSQGNLVLILNSSVGMFTNFLGGPLLRRFGYRKVAVAGAILSSLGLFVTAVTSSFWMFILWYSIVNSIGVGATLTSFIIAVNSFFKEKRGRAIGVAMFVTGLGVTLMPLLGSALLTAFGWRYTALILSAICLHSLVAACLLRPVKWYLRYPPHSEEMVSLNMDTKLQQVSGYVEPSTIEIGENTADDCVATSKSVSETYLPGATIQQQKSLFRKFIDLFDLTLLNDPIFVNILLGMSIANCVENNFFILLPIILEDMMKFKTEQIARLLSIIGATDTVSRLVTPFFGEWCKGPPRVMFLVGLVLIILFRTMMLFLSSFLGMVFLALGIGIMRGYRMMYNVIIIPSYVPIERLPFAWGLQQFANGLISVTIGSVLGRLRERSGAYYFPLIVLNFITVWTILSWSAEYVYFRISNRNNGNTSKKTEQ